MSIYLHSNNNVVVFSMDTDMDKLKQLLIDNEFSFNIGPNSTQVLKMYENEFESSDEDWSDSGCEY